VIADTAAMIPARSMSADADVNLTKSLEINLLLTLDLREQAALQAALVTHVTPTDVTYRYPG